MFTVFTWQKSLEYIRQIKTNLENVPFWLKLFPEFSSDLKRELYDETLREFVLWNEVKPYLIEKQIEFENFSAKKSIKELLNFKPHKNVD